MFKMIFIEAKSFWSGERFQIQLAGAKASLIETDLTSLMS
jgi:hypothetical protein